MADTVNSEGSGSVNAEGSITPDIVATALSILCIVWLVILSGAAQAKPLQWELEGIKDELKQNTSLYLEALPAIEPAQLKSHKTRITKAVYDSLQALGYYQPTVTIKPPAANSHKALITVHPGDPVIIKHLNITLLGDAVEDEAFDSLLTLSSLKEGAVLNDGHYESLKGELTQLAAARGYFDATISRHSISVYPEERIAIIDLTFNSDRRYTFGEINYSEINEATKTLLSTLIDIKPGEPYNSVKIGKLTQDISSTGYFSRVNVYPERQRTDNYQVPVYIGVTPNLDHEFEVGAGFSTDEGPRFSVNWKKPWVNNYGHGLTNEAKISSTTAELTSSYKIPDGNPLQDYYNLQLGYQKKQLKDTNSDLVSASVHRWNKRSLKQQGNWDQDLFFRVEYESYTQGEQNDSNLLLIPGTSFSRRRAKGGTDPCRGDQQLAKIEISNKLWGSSANFVKLWGRSKWLRTYYEKHRIITRVEQGAILQLDNITDIPPSFRFFTGGDQSVRGYNYESISPRDQDDKLTGARYMTVSSFEYTYSVAPKWRLATLC